MLHFSLIQDLGMDQFVKCSSTLSAKLINFYIPVAIFIQAGTFLIYISQLCKALSPHLNKFLKSSDIYMPIFLSLSSST